MGKVVKNAKKIGSDLLACKKAFDNVKIPWVITDGIVLGYARNKKIMEWDTDLDIAVCVEINKGQWTSLFNSLNTEGFRKIKNEHKDFICGRRLTPLNLWFFHKSGDYYEAFPKSTPGIKFVEKRIWYDKPKMVDFLGSKYPMPNNINDYLDNHYGKDWKINIIKDHQVWFKKKRGALDALENQPLWLKGRSGKQGDLWPKIIKINDTMENNNE